MVGLPVGMVDGALEGIVLGWFVGACREVIKNRETVRARASEGMASDNTGRESINVTLEPPGTVPCLGCVWG